MISFLCCVFGGVHVVDMLSFLCCYFGGIRVAHMFSFLCCVVFYILFVFVLCLVCPMLTVSLCISFLNVPSVFSNVYSYKFQ
jgi:hypothetical protein